MARLIALILSCLLVGCSAVQAPDCVPTFGVYCFPKGCLTESSCLAAAPQLQTHQTSSRLIGQDTLALLHPLFAVPPSTIQGTPLGALDWTFGTDVRPLAEVLARVKPELFRVHILNTTCVRNQNCGKYEPLYGYTITSLDAAIKNHEAKILTHLRARVGIYKDLSSKFAATRMLLSPALEHDLTPPSWRILADNVLAVWPEVQLVNSPIDLSRAERYRGAWIEGHGPLAPSWVDINSLDGQDATDISIAQWTARFIKVKVLYVWSRVYNCRNQGPWEDPRARKSCANGPTSDLLQHITDKRGSPPQAPKLCKNGVQPFKSPSIWKPLAEDKGSGDPRANLPVVIFDGGTSRVEVLGADGTSKGFLGHYGIFQGTQRRYYSGQIGSGRTGYQFSKGWAFLKQGKRCVGPLIPGRRQGAMR